MLWGGGSCQALSLRPGSRRSLSSRLLGPGGFVPGRGLWRSFPGAPSTEIIATCFLRTYTHTCMYAWMFQRCFYRYRSRIGIDIEPNPIPRLSKPTASPIEHGLKSATRCPAPREDSALKGVNGLRGGARASNMLKHVGGCN